ncbi:MAG: Fic family protein, partial [Candidatus Electrothrix sp. AUS1_2]|nr:Fic family protein [Candidatus Electrothrix sp. AUS1_2]
RAAGVKYLPTMLSNYYYREIDSYFIAFSECRKNKESDLTPFVRFVLRGAVESLHEMNSRITAHLRTSALNNYFQSLRAAGKINSRQFELLSLLLQAPEEQCITVSSIRTELPYRALYASVSDRTAKRDLTRLLELKLVTAVGAALQLDRKILNAL